MIQGEGKVRSASLSSCLCMNYTIELHFCYGLILKKNRIYIRVEFTRKKVYNGYFVVLFP